MIKYSLYWVPAYDNIICVIDDHYHPTVCAWYCMRAVSAALQTAAHRLDRGLVDLYLGCYRYLNYGNYY